jgi:predicted nucleic acid-binding protein
MTLTDVAAVLRPLIESGQIATCGFVELEVLYSARNQDDMRRTRAWRSLAFTRVAMMEADFLRAEAVLDLLAARGQHRTAPLPDLLIAACAERSELTVLHYDQDFDRIAAVTSQPVEWVVPRGSV